MTLYTISGSLRVTIEAENKDKALDKLNKLQIDDMESILMLVMDVRCN